MNCEYIKCCTLKKKAFLYKQKLKIVDYVIIPFVTQPMYTALVGMVLEHLPSVRTNGFKLFSQNFVYMASNEGPQLIKST